MAYFAVEREAGSQKEVEDRLGSDYSAIDYSSITHEIVSNRD
jgi:hypothetical protein